MHRSLISVNETDVLQPLQYIFSHLRHRAPVRLSSWNGALTSTLTPSCRCFHNAPIFFPVPCEKHSFSLLSASSRVKRVSIAHLPPHEGTVDVTVRFVNESVNLQSTQERWPRSQVQKFADTGVLLLANKGWLLVMLPHAFPLIAGAYSRGKNFPPVER